MMITTHIHSNLTVKIFEAKDLQQNDVLNISYDTTGSFKDSSFYDVIVTRNVVDGVKCTSINDSKGEYTIGGTKYKAAEGMDIDVETSTEYSLYLDHFGRIAKADENSVSKNYERIEEHLQEGRRATTWLKSLLRKVLKKSTK